VGKGGQLRSRHDALLSNGSCSRTVGRFTSSDYKNGGAALIWPLFSLTAVANSVASIPSTQSIGKERESVVSQRLEDKQS